MFNTGRHHVRVSASIEQYAEGAGNLSAAGWLRVEPGDFLVTGLEDRTITVTVEVPDEKLPSGGRYAAVALNAVSVDPLQDLGATTARADIPFLINVDGEGPLLREAAVDWFVPVLEPNGLVGFRARLVNRGNVHFAASGTVEISGPDGLLATRPAFAESPAVFPTEGQVLAAGPRCR